MFEDSVRTHLRLKEDTFMQKKTCNQNIIITQKR